MSSADKRLVLGGGAYAPDPSTDGSDEEVLRPTKNDVLASVPRSLCIPNLEEF
jgi:hypothetical protein